MHGCSPMEVFFDTCVTQVGGSFTAIFWYSGDFTDSLWSIFICGPGSETDWVTWKPGGSHPMQNDSVLYLVDTCHTILDYNDTIYDFDEPTDVVTRYFDVYGNELFVPLPKNVLIYDSRRRKIIAK